MKQELELFVAAVLRSVDQRSISAVILHNSDRTIRKLMSVMEYIKRQSSKIRKLKNYFDTHVSLTFYFILSVM